MVKLAGQLAVTALLSHVPQPRPARRGSAPQQPAPGAMGAGLGAVEAASMHVAATSETVQMSMLCMACMRSQCRLPACLAFPSSRTLMANRTGSPAAHALHGQLVTPCI